MADFIGAVKSLTNKALSLTADFLENGDFISRTIGINKSYNDIMFMIQSLGREPISLLGKDYLFIYDHVRRNYLQGTQVMNMNYNVPKFTFYKEKPTIRFADVDNDPLNLLDRWFPNIKFTPNMASDGTESFYAESFDGLTNNKSIQPHIENEGIAHGGVASFGNLSTKDLLRKTNENFRHGKYETLVARFHTNAEHSKANNDIKQTANSRQYGMSHGRNLLKLAPSNENGYDNPYCRVWTYHHQYDRMTKTIRPFIEDVESQEDLESLEQVGLYNTVGFRTKDISSIVELEGVYNGDNKNTAKDKNHNENNFLGGSKLLDKYGTLNFTTGFVNIAPTAKLIDYFDGKEDNEEERRAVSLKKCMFSIENLAWKNTGTKNNEYSNTGLSPEQRGPLGGRIMWFPPYDINFSEESRVEWNGNQFIGRGEKIYTYSNTERTGSLSFTLLIDHPSILDYWNGHERNGMKNQGTDLAKGNAGGVDKLDNQENTLLRFFAGCEVLSAKPQKYFVGEKKPEKVEEKIEKNVKEPEVARNVIKGKIFCCLYFPNNYSGVNDYPTVNSNEQFNAIYYLMNGFGTGKYINQVDGENCFKAVDFPISIKTPSSNLIYECDVEQNSESCSGDNKCTIFSCHENGKVTNPQRVNDFKGGYEVYNYSGMGISVATEHIKQAYVKKTYACTGSGVRGRFITNGDGSKRYVYLDENGKYLELAKINGPSLKNETQKLMKSWCYRVDNKYVTDNLSNLDSYLDLNSYGLNGVNYEKVREVSDFGVQEDSSAYTLISFADLFCALEEDQSCVDPVNKKNVELIRDIMRSSDTYKVTKLTFKGHASSAGYSIKNNELATNRANTLKNWMQNKNFPGDYQSEPEKPLTQSAKSNPNIGKNSELLSKLWRSAEVVIDYEIYNTSSPIQLEKFSSVNLVNTSIPNKNTSNPILAPGTYYDLFGENAQATIPGDNSTKTDKRKELEKLLPMDENTEFEERLNRNVNKMINELIKNEVDEENKYTVNRYDNEGEFFELLEKNSPFMHHLITDKIKYFDPAYHSISPEGFNARLTFLHQCTRQGSTAENSHFETSSAYNLAFGRPPVCVLRLGDFYYTKILINNLTIQYDEPQWDLNPEGIGVMPMFAKINLTFSFIGGSDLAGPISRLQNAVSFNYYANTSVYDNRADRVEYDPNKTGKEIKYRPFDCIK